MQHHRNGRAPRALPDPTSREYEAQKLVLLELVVDPPATGDRIEALGTLLELTRADLEAAVKSLAGVGLAYRCDGVVLATEAATYFEHLWPTAL